MRDASDFDAVRDGIGVDTGTSSGDEETVAAAHAALDRLESQNQALQERAEKAEAVAEAAQLLEAQRRRENQALQERIETAARYVGKMNHTLSREGWHTSQHCARCDLEPLLSPTQETDPDDIEEIGRGIARDFGKTFDILAKADRPTQETDPE